VQAGTSRRELLERAGAGALALGMPGILAACDTGAEPTPAPNDPVRGGTLRVGTLFGTGQDLDPHRPETGKDAIARQRSVYQQLAAFDPEGKPRLLLAESLEPNARGDEWIVRLRPDVRFHDGSRLTPEDVIFSYRRILDEKNELEGATDLQMIDPKGLVKLDASTLRIQLRYPYADLISQVGQRTASIVKDGTTTFAETNGTGPFRVSAWTPQERMTLVAFDDYWEDVPSLDRVELRHIADPSARLNALRGGQVDAISDLEAAQVPIAQADDELEVLVAESDGWTAIYMDTKAPPFDDVRVRQAMRLIADRQQILDQAQSGLGALGNDLFGRSDPLYAADLPQRERDLDQARSLLRAAGQENLQVTLHTADAAAAMLSSALVFSEQAKDAGIRVTPKRYPSDGYWTNAYGKVPLAQTSYGHRPLMAQYLQVLDPDGEWTASETNWDEPRSTKLFREAVATTDPDRQKELMHEVQRIHWETGGYLIWGFATWLSAHRKGVVGFVPDVNFPFNNFTFTKVSLAA
jgi:peptide/nickel transport system substrate-binding protein